MNWQRAIPTNRSLATAVTVLTVVIMLTPLRSGGLLGTQHQAGWVPLPILGGMHDTPAFQRRQASPSGHMASDTPLSRAPQVTLRPHSP